LSHFWTAGPIFRQFLVLNGESSRFFEDFVTALDLLAFGYLYVSKSREVYAVGCLLTYQTLAQPANYQQTKRFVRLEFFGY
jgi:hypothetical protein